VLLDCENGKMAINSPKPFFLLDKYPPSAPATGVSSKARWLKRGRVRWEKGGALALFGDLNGVGVNGEMQKPCNRQIMLKK
jgi:hypothetical protein